MATTITGLANDVLVKEMMVQAAKNGLVSANAFSTAATLTEKVVDDVIRVPVMTAATVATKTPGTAGTDSGGSSATSVTLDKYRYSDWQINEGECTKETAAVLFRGMAVEATYALCKDVLDYLFALVTTANFATASTIAPGDFGQGDLGDLWVAAEGKKLGRQRSLILNASMTGALIGESALALVLATMGKNALATAQLPPLMGFDCYNYSPLPTAENLVGLVTDKASLVLGMAPPSSLLAPGEGNRISEEILTDAESSVVMRYTTMGEADGAYIKGRVELIFGVKKLLDTLVRIKSA